MEVSKCHLLGWIEGQQQGIHTQSLLSCLSILYTLYYTVPPLLSIYPLYSILHSPSSPVYLSSILYTAQSLHSCLSILYTLYYTVPPLLYTLSSIHLSILYSSIYPLYIYIFPILLHILYTSIYPLYIYIFSIHLSVLYPSKYYSL